MQTVAARLLGGMMCHAAARSAGVADLRPEHFAVSTDRLIFAVLADLHAKGGAVDAVIVCSTLKDRGQLQAAGGTMRLAELWDAACQPGEVPGLIRQLLAGP